MQDTANHKWKFFRSGGVDQVMLRNGEDLAHLKDLDLKLWMALAMPTSGIEFDPKTAALLDADKDGRIRPPEVIAAVEWCSTVFNDLGELLEPDDKVALSSIKDPSVLAGAKQILSGLGKEDASHISLEDLQDQVKVFVNTRFNGDGVIIPESTDNAALAQAIADITAATGGTADLSGKQGLDQAQLDAFTAEANAAIEWSSRITLDKSIAVLPEAQMNAAHAAIQSAKVKVDDYFARCRLLAFDPRTRDAINRDAKAYEAIVSQNLSLSLTEVADFPLSAIEADKPLSLVSGINPAWADAISKLASDAVTPILGAGKSTLSEKEWISLQDKVGAYGAWLASRPTAEPILALGTEKLKQLSAPAVYEALVGLIQKDQALANEYSQITAVEKMVYFKKDLKELLTNFVNFSDFYGKSGAVFQAGTLYLDARSCHLCINVADAGKHAALAGLSAAYLAYCDISRPGEGKRTIAAVFTDGDSDRLIVGRNGVFYDRNGNDWDATITKIVSNPISIREAFLMPYKKLVRMIEEQIAKRAQEADTASSGKLGDVAGKVATADKIKSDQPAPAPKKLDLGTIALIGTAIGGVSALVGGFLSALFGLGMWLPLGIIGILLLISGPSMLLAWMKLRQRNLGPILDANGWAINTKAKMNVPFGAALTNLAELPVGSERALTDPYAEKKRPWKLWIFLLILIGLAWFWYDGKFDAHLPAKFTSAQVCKKAAPEADPSAAAPDTTAPVVVAEPAPAE